jgi:hypothetical protein
MVDNRRTLRKLASGTMNRAPRVCRGNNPNKKGRLRGNLSRPNIIAGCCLACFLHVCRLRTFRPLDDFKLDRISFLQSAVAVTSDCGIMDENIGPIVAPNEAVTF